MGKYMRFMLTAICYIIILAQTVVAVLYLLEHSDDDVVVWLSGEHSLDFQVFYFEDTHFGKNPNPICQSQDFLMSHTDYIEIYSSFTIDVSERMDLYYSYSAQARLVIRNIATTDGSSGNIVFQEVFPLNDLTGQIAADQLSTRVIMDNGSLINIYQFRFNAQDSDYAPDGMFRIYPAEFIEKYIEFIESHSQQLEYQSQQLGIGNVIAQGLRGFSAELVVDFKFGIRSGSAGMGLNQVATYGYHFPLTTEVFNLATAGTPNIEWERIVIANSGGATLPIIVIFVIIFAASVFGVIYNLRQFTANTNLHQREADEILKKYSNEIVVYDKPVNLTQYESIPVQEFGELLKLAVNLNKHIMCYRDDLHTSFVVIVDNFACLYTIDYNCDRIP